MSNRRCELYAPSSGGPPILIGGSVGYTLAIRFVPFMGMRSQVILSTQEGRIKWPIPASGNLTNFRGRAVTASTLTASTIMTLRKNGADTAIVFTFDQAAGNLITIAGPLSVAAADLLCWKVVSAAPTGLPASDITISTEFTAS